MMQKVTEIKRPLEVGEKYLVPCFVENEVIDYEVDENSELKLVISSSDITPIIYHAHSDKENGQEEVHFHIDTRFKSTGAASIRPVKTDKNVIKWLPMEVTNKHFGAQTPVEFISKSKLKHKCIHKGKCPHRGFDLSQVPVINGTITCPLHSLKFNANTRKIINA